MAASFSTDAFSNDAFSSDAFELGAIVASNFTDPKYPAYALPKDTQEFRDFITGQLAAPSGCLVTDYRNALASAQTAGEAHSVLSVQDEFKKWWEAGKPYTA